jgi:hypothetical protein
MNGTKFQTKKASIHPWTVPTRALVLQGRPISSLVIAYSASIYLLAYPSPVVEQGIRLAQIDVYTCFEAMVFKDHCSGTFSPADCLQGYVPMSCRI